jgi:sulfate transport system permease protein
MNCCDDFGQCTGGHNCAARAELAPTLVASRTTLPPEGAVLAWGGPALRTRHYFAPGAIEGHRHRRWLTPRRVAALVRALLVLACLAALAVTLAFAAGYLGFGGLQ